MIVDSSALVAILAAESERDRFLRIMAQAPIRRTSAASLLENKIVLNRILGPQGDAILEDFVAAAEVEVVPFSPAQSRLAFDAYRPFDNGMGHPAQLNTLDGCAYALAA